SRNSKLEGRKVWKVIRDLTARKEIPIVEFQSEQPFIEDCNSSSSGSDSENPIADLNSPSSEGPSYAFERLSPKFSPLFSKFSRDHQEGEPLREIYFEEFIPIPQRPLTPHHFVSPPRSPPQNKMA
ncbi:hypothetical protein KI387_044711, partial [Taxus chinensis]